MIKEFGVELETQRLAMDKDMKLFEFLRDSREVECVAGSFFSKLYVYILYITMCVYSSTIYYIHHSS